MGTLGSSMSDHATAKGETTADEPTRTREVHARRVAEVKALVPDAAMRTTVRMHDDTNLGARAIHALAVALREHPTANGAWRDGRIERYERINVALVLEGEDGPVSPTIVDADAKDVRELAAEYEALATRAGSEALSAPEVRGATTSVLDVSPFGITEATPLLGSGHAVALAIGAPVSGSVTLTLVCDARVLHGPAAARVLAAVAASLTS